MKVLVLLNALAGTLRRAATPQLSAQRVREALDAAGVAAELRAIDADAMRDTAREAAAAFDAVVAAGGDGTVSAIASALAGTVTPLGVIPIGTLNHFARDLHIPPAPDAAARVVAARNLRDVDLGRVNDETFINNASLGLYPHMISTRNRQRQRLGRGKRLAMGLAIASTFRRFPTVCVRIGVGQHTILRTTPFMFVGNNHYDIDRLTLGTRAALDQGVLSFYFANRTGRWGMFRLALRALLGKLEQAKDFDTMHVTECWIETSKRPVRVAIDGELRQLIPPLHFRIDARSLRVLAPPPPPAMDQALKAGVP